MASEARSFSLGGAAAVVVPAGLVCAAADIGYVIVLVLRKGGSPFRMLQGIAFSLLGRATYEGGVATAALGLAIHTGVAFGAAALFFALYRGWALVRAHWLASGVAFGAVFYVFMQLVALPLTRMPHQPFPPPNWVPIFVAHLTAVGPAIAAVTRWRAGE
ncbi:MAG: hypothetical protein HYV96_04730 [Opitutae bacterium]|nr:hypothetical protein [Opitutae bacterium]